MTAAGVVGAFAASALLHAYPGWVAGMRPSEVASVCAFFLLHGVLMLVERAWLRWRSGGGSGGGGKGGSGGGGKGGGGRVTVGGGGDSSASEVLWGRVWFWSCLLLSLPLICEPFFSLFGGGNTPAVATV